MANVVDPRLISTGREIPSEVYADQPYLVRTDDGAWLCVLTTGSGREGEPGQRVITQRSFDQGKSWSTPVALEPGDARENSYAVLLKVPSGRVFCFYNHNTDNLRAVRADDPPYSGGLCHRVDSLGHFVFRYSDDHGRTWSASRTSIPVRPMEIDRQNAYSGSIRFFWNVGKPFMAGGAAYVSLHKVGGFGAGFFTRSEGVLLRSPDLHLCDNPAMAQWETLPDGDQGIRTPPGGGPIAEEHSYSVMSDGSLFVVFRTVDGHPACSYSRDGGRTWSPSSYMRYADGRRMKHPRAANFAWRCSNGKYVYWFHNHGGRFVAEMTEAMAPYADRNPVWLCGGVEVRAPGGLEIRWSQPEIVLYDDDPFVRISYPDLLEEGGKCFLTETQKQTARVHEVAPDLLEGLWEQGTQSVVPADGLLARYADPGGIGGAVAMPRLPAFLERDADRRDHGTRDLRAGFSIALTLSLRGLDAGHTVLDSRDSSGRGVHVFITQIGALAISLSDGRSISQWDCDPGILPAGSRHHITICVDGGPKTISFVVDGRLCDGGESRQFGWGRFNPNLRDANGSDMLAVGQPPACRTESLLIYGRCLRTSEAVGIHHAACQSREIAELSDPDGQGSAQPHP